MIFQRVQENKMENELTFDDANEVLKYDPATGLLRWRIDIGQRARAGNVAGFKNSIGYVIIKINGKPYKAHRLAWLLTHKNFPANFIDHRNRVRDDNRIGNLQDATNVENGRNRKLNNDNSSGVCGVVNVGGIKQWTARITVDGKLLQLGRFVDISDAISARQQADIKYGFSSLHGQRLRSGGR